MFFSGSCLPSNLANSGFTQVIQMHPRILAWKWRKCHDPRGLLVWGVHLFTFGEWCYKFCLPTLFPQNEKRNKTKSNTKKIISLSKGERKWNSLKEELKYLSPSSVPSFCLHGKGKLQKRLPYLSKARPSLHDWTYDKSSFIPGPTDMKKEYIYIDIKKLFEFPYF